MSRRVERWENFESSCKANKKKIKSMSGINEFLNNKTESGEIYDTRKKETLKISEIKAASTIRRILRTVDNYYYLATMKKDQEYILERKKELEAALNNFSD